MGHSPPLRGSTLCVKEDAFFKAKCTASTRMSRGISSLLCEVSELLRFNHQIPRAGEGDSVAHINRKNVLFEFIHKYRGLQEVQTHRRILGHLPVDLSLVDD